VEENQNFEEVVNYDSKKVRDFIVEGHIQNLNVGDIV